MKLSWRGIIPSLAICALCSCSDNLDETVERVPEPKDVHSYSNPADARTVHLSLDLDVDFETRIISGTARHTIEHHNASQFILDTRNLNIIKITINNSDEDINFSFTGEDPILGKGVIVPINKATRTVTVYYFTDPDAAALGWLEPEQTADKQGSFLYTQGQAILTRTWIPLQDSPGVRFTYDATVRVPPGMLAVMSAENPTEVNPQGEYQFEMQQPIPGYLMALAVGNIAFAPVGPRTGVYAEPSLLEAATYEFGEMEQMLEAAERLYGPYVWDRYDVIVLPPGFPFGGMENPRLTFVTPTILAGDRSLVALIAHELAHSWSGNLVTNKTWNDFWLNEGFTVYFERRIMEEVYGKDYTNMLALLGRQDLEDEVEELGPGSADTHLELHLEGRNPDDGMTDIAYEKGALFLTLLEQKAGRETFDAFLKKYFEENRFQTMHTGQFIAYLRTYLLEPNGLDVDIDAWIFGPGIPENAPEVSSDRFEKVDSIVDRTMAQDEIPELPANWSTHEWLHYVRNLPDTLSIDKMKALDDKYRFTESGNSEIAAAWYEKAIKSGYDENITDSIRHFLITVGRRKFLTPLYKAYKETGEVERARSIYKEARPNYHAVSRETLEALLEYKVDI